MYSDTRSPKQRTLDIIALFTAAPITEKAELEKHLSIDPSMVGEMCTEIEAEFGFMFDEDNEINPVDESYTLEFRKWVTVADVIQAVYRMVKQ